MSLNVDACCFAGAIRLRLYQRMHTLRAVDRLRARTLSSMRTSAIVRRAAAVGIVLGFIVQAASSAPPTAAAPPAATPASPPPTKIYDESADAKAQIAAALAKAKLENRRVLVQWGGNWCPWCVKLHGLMSSDREIARTLQYEYDVVLVDAGRPVGKNVDLAKSYGAAVETKGFPYLTVLDANGKAIANQETESLERKNADGTSVGLDAGHDPAAVLAFLKKHQSEPVVAWAAYDAALREARESDRRIFVTFGAPWCPWCHRLDDWMRSPAVAALLAKEFVVVKIDVDRMTDGKQLFAKLNPTAAKSGLPWFAFLGSDGAMIVNATMSDGANTGFPAEPKEIEHFTSMLRTAAKRLSADQKATLVELLRAARPRPAGAPHAPAPAVPAAPVLTDDQKIEALIDHVAGLRDAKFIRNGTEYDAKDAAAHLRRKLSAQRSSIKSVEDFIRLCGTGSSVSGDAYQIRMPDGREVACATYLRQQLGAQP